MAENTHTASLDFALDFKACIINVNKSILRWVNVNNVRPERITTIDVKSMFLSQIKKWVVKDRYDFKKVSPRFHVFIDLKTKYIAGITLEHFDLKEHYKEPKVIHAIHSILNTLDFESLWPTEEQKNQFDKIANKTILNLESIKKITF